MSNAPLATGAPRELIDPLATRAGRSDFAVRLRANSEYVVIPLLALVIAAGLFAFFLMAIGKSPVDFVAYVWRGGFGTAFSFQNTLQRSAPLDSDRARGGYPRPDRPHHDRRRGSAGARRIRGGRAGHSDDRPCAADGGARPHGAVRHDRRRLLGGLQRISALRARRQRDDLIAAHDLHRHRDHELLRRGRAARSLQSQQAVDHADRRRLYGRQDPRDPGALGLRFRSRPVRRALLLDGAHDLRFRGAGDRRQLPRRARARAARGAADCRLFRDRGRLRGARGILRSGGYPGARQRLACSRLRLYRHSGVVPCAPQSARHSRRSRFCSAGWSPRAASFSGAWNCPTRRSLCCRDSSSSSC